MQDSQLIKIAAQINLNQISAMEALNLFPRNAECFRTMTTYEQHRLMAATHGRVSIHREAQDLCAIKDIQSGVKYHAEQARMFQIAFTNIYEVVGS